MGELKHSKNNTNKTVQIKEKLYGTTSTVYVISNVLLDMWLYPLLEEKLNKVWLSALIIAIFSAFWFLLIHKAVSFLYNQFVFKKKNKHLMIEGIWFHVHVPRTRDDEIEYGRPVLRAGKAQISRDCYDFYLDSVNYDYSVCGDRIVSDVAELDKNRTRWHTLAQVTEPDVETDLIEIYQANSTKDINKDGKNRRGIHKFKFIADDSGNIVELEGKYQDCFPSLRGGDLLLFRDEAARDAVICEYFKKRTNAAE